MSIGRIGGLMLMGGVALLGIAGSIVMSRGMIGIDGDLHPWIAAALGLVGFAAVILGLSGPAPLRRGAVQLGLIGLAIGSFPLAFAVLVWSSLRGIELTFLLVPLVGGASAIGAGALAIGLSLARKAGLWRWTGLALLTGLTLVLLGTWGETARPLGAMAEGVQAVGVIVIALAGLALGGIAAITSEAP